MSRTATERGVRAPVEDTAWAQDEVWVPRGRRDSPILSMYHSGH